MNSNNRSSGSVVPAKPYVSGADEIGDKMNADSEQELTHYCRAGSCAELAEAFELDIHDCSVSEVNR